MDNKVTSKYHFESTHEPYTVRKIDVEKKDDKYTYTIDNVVNIIDCNNKSLTRQSDDMEMFFDFNNHSGYVKLLEVNSTLPFEIIEADLKVENSILHLDFKYILDQEMFVSLSIV